jgi:hypothetical protein
MMLPGNEEFIPLSDRNPLLTINKSYITTCPNPISPTLNTRKTYNSSYPTKSSQIDKFSNNVDNIMTPVVNNSTPNQTVSVSDPSLSSSNNQGNSNSSSAIPNSLNSPSARKHCSNSNNNNNSQSTYKNSTQRLGMGGDENNNKHDSKVNNTERSTDYTEQSLSNSRNSSSAESTYNTHSSFQTSNTKTRNRDDNTMLSSDRMFTFHSSSAHNLKKQRRLHNKRVARTIPSTTNDGLPSFQYNDGTRILRVDGNTFDIIKYEFISYHNSIEDILKQESLYFQYSEVTTNVRWIYTPFSGYCSIIVIAQNYLKYIQNEGLHVSESQKLNIILSRTDMAY